MGEKSGDRLFFLAFEFCAMAGHLSTPEDICSLLGSIASSSPRINSPTIRLLSWRTGVIHVVTR
jgi:hypothetical protein